MNLRIIKLIIAMTALLLLVACDDGGSTTGTPSANAVMTTIVSPSAANIATVPVEPTVVPTPTVAPSPTVVPTPTVTPTPTVVPTPTAAPAPTVVPTPTVSPIQAETASGADKAIKEALAEAAPNGPRGVGRLYQLPVNPYLLVSPEGTTRFRGYGTKNSSPEHPDVPVSVHWEFIGSPGSSVFAPASTKVMDILPLDGGDYSVLLNGASNPFWVWELKHVKNLTVEVGDDIEATKKLGVISEAGSLLLGLKEQQDPLRERADLPRYHCPLISLHPVGFVEMQLEMIRATDSERLGIKADLIDELTPCAVTTPLPELPVTGSVIDETQRQIDAAFATTAIWDPMPKTVPVSSFVGHDVVAGLAYRLPVDPEAIIAHITTLEEHVGTGYVGQAVAEDAFHGYGYKRPFEDGNFEGFDVGWYFLAAPGTPVVAPVAGQVVRIVQLKPDEPDMTIVINQTGEPDWTYENNDWSWGVGHVVDVRVEVGDMLEIGQIIAKVAPDWNYENEDATLAWNAGIDFGLTEYVGGEVGSLHHCPLIAIDPEGLISAQLELIRQALGAHAGIDPDDHPRWTICATDQPFGGDHYSGGGGVVPNYDHMRDVP